MNTAVLTTILLLSLALNVWLALGRRPAAPAADRRMGATVQTATGPAGTSEPTQSTASKPAAAPAWKPVVWDDPGARNEDLRAFAGRLQAAGFPPGVIVRFIGAMLREQTHAPLLDLPYWQLMHPSPESRKLMTAAALELLRRQEDILGPAGTQAATLDPVYRRLQYGDLGDAKINTILRIERDYQDMMQDLSSAQGGAMTREEAAARQEQIRTLEKNRMDDIAAALTPEEYAEYERHNSRPAQRVIGALANVIVTEQEYLALLQFQKAFDPTGVAMLYPTGAGPSRQTEVFTLHDNIKGLLGEERADRYLRASDYQYASVAAFADKHPSLTRAQTQELYRLQFEAQAAVVSQPGAARPDPQKLQQTMSVLNERLDALLGPEIAKAYRASNVGSFFQMFQPRPTLQAGNPPSGNAIPAVRLPGG
jgi:hypothetical protein